MRRSELMKDGLYDVAVSARQNLPEDRAGNLHGKRLALGPAQPRRLEPRRKRIDADAGLHALKQLVPQVGRFAVTPGLDRSRHWMRKRKPLDISTDVKKLWKAGPLVLSFWLRGLHPRRNVLLCPCRSARDPFGF